MMKVSELSGFALDWAVAKCEGLLCFGYRTDGERFAVKNGDSGIGRFMPSTDWAQGGPIIERERIDVYGFDGEQWGAEDNFRSRKYGDTPLIAAMRCYVASKLGEEITVPEAFLETSN